MSSQWIITYKYWANMEPDRVRIDADDVMLNLHGQWVPAHGRGFALDTLFQAIEEHGWEYGWEPTLQEDYFHVYIKEPEAPKGIWLKGTIYNFKKEKLHEALLGIYISLVEELHPQPWYKNNIDNHIAYYESQWEHFPNGPWRNDLREYIDKLRRQKMEFLMEAEDESIPNRPNLKSGQNTTRRL